MRGVELRGERARHPSFCLEFAIVCGRQAPQTPRRAAPAKPKALPEPLVYFSKDQMTFSELGLSEKVLQAVTAAGYTTPTPIQEQADRKSVV